MKRIIESKVPGFFEVAFITFAVILYSDGIISVVQRVLLHDNQLQIGGEEGNILQQVCYVVIFLIASFFFIKRRNSLFTLIFKNKLIIALLLLCFLSSFWSTNPSVTLRRSFGLTLTTFFSFYLVTNFTLLKVTELINKGLVACMVLSILFVVLLPEMGLHTNGEHKGAWRGIYVHKNILGAISSLQCITSLSMYYLTSNKKHLLFWLLGLFVLIFARSTSSLIITLLLSLLSLGIIKMNNSKHETKSLYIILILFLILTSLAVYINIESIFVFLGKDMTFTGRTLLWYNLFEYIQKEPILGYGYGSFWLGEHSLSGKIWHELGWEMPHAHNGYINITLEIGMIGLVLFITLLIKKMRLLIGKLFVSKNNQFLWPFLVISFFIIGNFSETYILKQNSIYWVLFVYSITFSLNKPNTFFKTK